MCGNHERWCVGCGKPIPADETPMQIGHTTFVGKTCCPDLRLATGQTCVICKVVAGRACRDLNTGNKMRMPHRSRAGSVEAEVPEILQ